MTRKYEAHITMPREQSADVAHHAPFLDMTFSAIDGDPVMGKQAYCYLTCYDSNYDALRNKVMTAAVLLEECGVQVLRKKIEEILYDSKTGHDARRQEDGALEEGAQK